MIDQPFSKKIISALDHVLRTMPHSIRDESVIVATSGGPDSTALLYSLTNLRKAYGFEIIAAFFDHGLSNPRYEDANIVNNMTTALSIQLLTGFGDAPLFAKTHKLSLEDACRKLRYQFFAQSAHQTGSKFTALGHTEDDQTETILLNLIRGSGLNGLTGMKTMTLKYDSPSETEMWLLRPLLDIKHSETIACCKENDLSTIEDQSNTNTKFRRNRLRTKVIPELRKLNPSINQAFKKLATNLQIDYAFIMHTSNEIYQDISSASPGTLTLDKPVLSSLALALQKQILQIAFMTFTGTHTSLSFNHIQAMQELLPATQESTLNLPCGVTFYSDRQLCQFYKKAPAPTSLGLPPQTILELPVPGTVTYGHWTFKASLEEALEFRKNLDPSSCAIVDHDTVGSSIAIRQWWPGDTFQPLGMSKSKKIQDFFVDEKVPRYKKSTIPLLVNPKGIFWIAGHRIAEWAKITDKTHTALVIRT